MPGAKALLPPGPGLPALLQTLRLQRDPLGALAGWARRFGDVFTLSLPPVGRLVVIAGPDAVKGVLTGDPAVFRAGAATRRLLPFLGDGSLLLADGDEHLRRRRQLHGLFHGDSIGRHASWIEEITEREIEQWPLGRSFPLLPRLRAVAFEVIVRLVLGPTGDAHRLELQARLSRMLSGVAILASCYSPRPGSRASRSPWELFARRRDAVDELLLESIRVRREDVFGEPADVLSLLLGGPSGSGAASAERALLDELRSLLIVGHETTASALAWALVELVRAPAALDPLVAELDGTDRPFLRAVVEETLRLRPPVLDAVRELAEPREIAGFRLPAGTIVAAALPLVHRRAELFADPGTFRPERFLERRPAPHAWIPFGGGMRRCLGAALATLELEVMLPVILRRFTVLPARPKPEAARLIGTMLVPARGAEVLLERRPTGAPTAPGRSTVNPGPPGGVEQGWKDSFC